MAKYDNLVDQNCSEDVCSCSVFSCSIPWNGHS